MRHGNRSRIFLCPRCRYITKAPKSVKHMTPKGHIKTMWCPMCQKMRGFVQIK